MIPRNHLRRCVRVERPPSVAIPSAVCRTRNLIPVAAACTVSGVSSEELIAEAGRRIAEEAPGARVIVFGSHARGDAGQHSDLDLLVVETEVESAAAESVRLRRALRGLPTAIDVIVVSQDYLDQWRNVRGSLVQAAMCEGRVVTG